MSASIVRRVIAQVRAHNWFPVAIDLVILILGVFIGIQASNWNDARIERSQEKGLLIRLQEDFAESIAGQQRDIHYLDRQLSDQQVILKSLDACAVAPGDEVAFERGINTLGYVNPPRLYRRTIDEMAGSGRTDLIRNYAIRDELAALVALVEWRAAGYDGSARTTEHYRYIVEEKVRYDLGRVRPDKFSGDFVGVKYDIGSFCRDPAIASAVSAISYATRERRNAYIPILDRYRKFLPRISDELHERWGLDFPTASNR